MTDASKGKMFSRDPGDRLIRAWVADEKGGGFHPVSCSIAAVDAVVGVGENGSALVLRSGITIPVALPYAALEKKIYSIDFREPVLDLRDLTGEAAKGIILSGLAKQLPSVEAPKEDEGVRITAVMRKRYNIETTIYEFSSTDILSMEAGGTDKSKCGKTIVITFNTASKKGPFGSNHADLDMPYDDFMFYLSSAKTSKAAKLDLCQIFAAHPQKYGMRT